MRSHTMVLPVFARACAGFMLSALLVLGTGQPAAAQPRKSLSGGIDVEESGDTALEEMGDGSLSGAIEMEEAEKRRDPYQDAQHQAIQFFAELLVKLANGPLPQSIALPKRDVFNHLSGVYLYCKGKNGICPLVLQGLLEVDVLHSHLSGEVACPALRAFWKQWLANGFEQRAKFLISTGNLVEATEWDEKERPKYLNCKGTIQGILDKYKGSAALPAERYKVGKPGWENMNRLKVFLELVQKKVPNVFVETGAK